MFLLRGCSVVMSLKFNIQSLNTKPVTLNLSTSHVRRRRSREHRLNRRPGHCRLLDKFLKHTSLDGSLIVRAPINLKCSASFFDVDNKIDSVKNYNVGMSREEANRLERFNRRKGVYSSDEEGGVSDNISDNGAGVFMQMEDIKDMTQAERNILSNIVNNNSNRPQQHFSEKRSLSPIHVSLYGRASHRVDSYSIMNESVTHSHVYISDANSCEEAVSMFSLENGDSTAMTPPSGQVDIWRQREVSQVEISSGVLDDSMSEEVASTFKVYCPTHLLQQEKNGISMLFHTPTLMNKIFLEAERLASIDVNGLLLDQLMTVGLVSEAGDVKVRDLWAEEIKLASNTGDILCYGTLEGSVRAETEGDFIARSVVGPRLEVLTGSGDICVWDDCHTDTAQLFTSSGNIHCNRLHSDAKVCIKNKGVATLNIVSGSVACVVKSGDIIAHLDDLSQDSFMEIESGNISVNVPSDCSFRISLVSPCTEISPHLLNSGEFYVKDGLEYFVSGVNVDNGDNITPILTIRCHEGMVSLQSPASRRTEDDSEES